MRRVQRPQRCAAERRVEPLQQAQALVAQGRVRDLPRLERGEDALECAQQLARAQALLARLGEVDRRVGLGRHLDVRQPDPAQGVPVGTIGYARTSIRAVSAAASLNSRYFYESFSSR